MLTLSVTDCRQPHLMQIDNITLGVFEDSGWYRVNYAYADDFIWGRGIISASLNI